MPESNEVHPQHSLPEQGVSSPASNQGRDAGEEGTPQQPPPPPSVALTPPPVRPPQAAPIKPPPVAPPLQPPSGSPATPNLSVQPNKLPPTAVPPEAKVEKTSAPAPPQARAAHRKPLADKSSNATPIASLPSPVKQSEPLRDHQTTTSRPSPDTPQTAAPGPLERRTVKGWWRKKRLRPVASAADHLAQQEEERRQIPSWLISFVFHLALLLVLALIPLSNLVSGPLTLVFGESGPEVDSEFELAGMQSSSENLDSELVEAEILEANIDPTEILQQIEIPELVSRDPSENMSATVLQNIPFGIKHGLTGRTGALKEALLSKFGGTAETEAAVELGLKWLAKQQKSNGSWSLTGPYSLGGSAENTTAATAMAINAFLGAGYTHKDGKYANNVKLGLAYLVRRQNSEGFFSTREPSRQQMYAQALASIAVTEAYGMSGDEDLKSSAMKAISFAEWSQSKLNGWRYEPREEADLSVTGWFVMALETAKMAGLPVNEKKLNQVTKFLDSVAHEQDTRYAYTDYERPSLSMTAEGLLCRIYLGWPRSHPALLAAIRDDLLPNRPSANEDEYSVYYYYYATQVLHHVGGRFWDEWNDAMRQALPAMQEKAGAEAGSWHPGKDVFGASGGRLYTTCLNLYCLEVYYRHLSIYDLK